MGIGMRMNESGTADQEQTLTVRWSNGVRVTAKDQTGVILREGAVQAARVIESYTRPARGSVSTAGAPFSLLQVNQS